MALPRQAQIQVDNANRILAELHEGDEPTLKVVEAEPPEPVVESVVELVEEDEQPEPAAEPVHAEPVHAELAPEPTKDLFEERYRVLQGKYNSEVPRLTRQVSDLHSQLAAMQATVEQLQTASQEAPVDSLITQEEIDEFGPDLVDLIGRKAKELYGPVINSLQSEVTSLKGQMGGVTQSVETTARERLLTKLDSEIEDWRVVNSSQDFIDWLDHVDPYSGEQRGRMLRLAYDKNDTERVMAFFTGFLAEHAAIQPTSDTFGSAAPARTPPVSLDDHVAPGRRKHSVSGTGAQKEKRIWTQAQIAAFYREVHQGKFRSREGEQRTTEKDILSAATEGRIR